MGRKITSTILRVYLLDKSRSGKEEGIIALCDENGIVTSNQIHFDHLKDVPEKIKDLLQRSNVQWPR